MSKLLFYREAADVPAGPELGWLEANALHSAFGWMARFAALENPGQAPPIEPLRIVSLSDF
jgi:hypothetical protein